jgi:hypothetical protein
VALCVAALSSALLLLVVIEWMASMHRLYGYVCMAGMHRSAGLGCCCVAVCYLGDCNVLFAVNLLLRVLLTRSV